MVDIADINSSVRPLVSVVIPCYNHAAYLPDAIESVLAQTYPGIEIIVVDDGSRDNTEAVAKHYPQVTYVYQENRGLSAARNTGIKVSSGDLLVFLDADDLLYEDAVAHNVQVLTQHPRAAFVSGSYDLVTAEKKMIKEVVRHIDSDHYLHFLRGNYISMHATVMYRRWVFDEFIYDTRLRACEDYDMYLRVARKYPVLHHTKKLAAYRMHLSNMSADFGMMLRQSLLVLEKQRPMLHSADEEKAFKEGLWFWKDYYCGTLYAYLRAGTVKRVSESISILKKYKPKLYYRYLIANCYEKIIPKNSA